MYRLFAACLLLAVLIQSGRCVGQTVLTRTATGQTGTIEIQATPPATLIGVAILHLDVPDGASVEIGGKPMASWTWSRYRHYWIYGVSFDERASVKIKVTIVRDLPECKQGILECTKQVHIMNGDRQNLRFDPADFTVWCAVQGEQCNGCKPTAEPKKDGEQIPPKAEDEKPGQTPKPVPDDDPHLRR